MTTDIAILSPEKTIVTYRLASLGSRIAAHFLDLLIAFAISCLILLFCTMLMGSPVQFFRDIGGLALPLVIASVFLYFILQEGLWNGLTLGKKSAGIRVRNIDGTPVTFQAAIGRNLLRIADMMPAIYFVGFASIFTTPKAQRIGDIVAGTIVVTEKRGVPRFAPAPHRLAGEHPFEASVGDLRGMTIQEYRALRRFCDRFPELSATIQERMTRDIWLPIAAKRSVPDVPGVHPIYLAEAAVMKYGRAHGLL